jgi:hypothetical protein
LWKLLFSAPLFVTTASANPTHRLRLSVVVKALFKGKVKALFDLFRRGQAISFFRLLLLPIIIWVEVNAAELDNDLVESCRALRCVAKCMRTCIWVTILRAYHSFI